MQRWRIVRTESFLQLAAIGAPFLVAPLATAVYSLGLSLMRWQDYVWDATNILGALAFTIVFAIPALIVGPIVGLVPGLVAGIAILMLSRFRPPNFIEAAIIGTAASGGFGWLLAGIAHGDPPLFAAFFALCGLMAAWIAAAVARRLGIVVPADDPIAEPAPPSGDYSLFEPRLVERPWALVRLAALWAPLTAGMAGVLLTAVLRWQNSGLHIAAALLPAIGFGAYRGLVFGILPGIAVSVIVLLFEERRRPLSVVQIAVVGTLVCAFAAWLPAHWNGLGAVDWVAPLIGALGGLFVSGLAGLAAIRFRILGPPTSPGP